MLLTYETGFGCTDGIANKKGLPVKPQDLFVNWGVLAGEVN
jgi:hypothetical protein